MLANLTISMKSDLFFSFVTYISGVKPMKLLPNSMSKRFPLCFLRNLKFSFKYRFLIYIELIFGYDVR